MSQVIDNRPYPFIVAVENDESRVLCAGNLLTLEYVLTACHCLFHLCDTLGRRCLPEPWYDVPKGKYYEESWYFDAGDVFLVWEGTTWPRDQQRRNASAIYHHPHCASDNGHFVNDIGLGRAKEAFKEAPGGNLKPAGLLATDPVKFMETFFSLVKQHSEPCLALGWVGFNSSVDVLKVWKVEKLNEKNCYDWYLRNRKHNLSGFDQLCSWPVGKYLSCNGRSGGPLICGGNFFAVMSYSRVNLQEYRNPVMVPFYQLITPLLKWLPEDYKLAPLAEALGIPPATEPPRKSTKIHLRVFSGCSRHGRAYIVALTLLLPLYMHLRLDLSRMIYNKLANFSCCSIA